jgi:hypothetical protein
MPDSIIGRRMTRCWRWRWRVALAMLAVIAGGVMSVIPGAN